MSDDRICSADGCDRPHCANGLCIGHYCTSFDDSATEAAADPPRLRDVSDDRIYRQQRRYSGDCAPEPPIPGFVDTPPPAVDDEPDWSLFVNPDDDEDPWQDRALCAQTDPESFFPEKGGSTVAAKRICSRCEVKAECLEYALAFDERFGIWGGLSERERRQVRRGRYPEVTPRFVAVTWELGDNHTNTLHAELKHFDDLAQAEQEVARHDGAALLIDNDDISRQRRNLLGRNDDLDDDDDDDDVDEPEPAPVPTARIPGLVMQFDPTSCMYKPVLTHDGVKHKIGRFQRRTTAQAAAIAYYEQLENPEPTAAEA